jgi:hypothetical protein
MVGQRRSEMALVARRRGSYGAAMRSLIPTLAIGGLATVATPALRAQSTSGISASGGFITTLGTDTIAVERYSRTKHRIEGVVAIRNPRTRTIDYTATLDANGSVTRFEMTSSMAGGPPTAPPVIERISTITDSVLTTEVRRNGARDTTASGRATLPRRGAVPFVQSGTAFAEQMVQQMLRAGTDSVQIPQFTFGPNHAFPSFVRRIGRDSVEINVGAPIYARIDPAGRLLGLSGRATTVKTETVRVPSTDLDAIVASWVAREKEGKAAGPVSARDTVRARVGAAEVWLDYGRPLRRGRTIFGNVVPWDTIWRTGANAATQFRTSADLKIGDATIPAGTYTLWTIPAPAGATLVVNKQTGQWGTQYDAKQDLVRIPMRSTAASTPVERLTIDFPVAGSGSALRIAWDTREMSVPITMPD